MAMQPMPIVTRGRTAVLTGAASGIGAALAHALAARGLDLALIDRDAEGLARIATETRLFGAKTTTHVVDLADPDAIAALPAAVAADHPAPALLINNAGVALAGTFEQMAIEEFEWVMAINFWAPVRLTKALLPVMHNEASARIVFLSSVFGLIAPPRQAAYAASKFAIRGFAESLRHELAGSGIGVTVVHPGGIRTNIARRARIAAGLDPAQAAASITAFEAGLKTTPQVAAQVILDGIAKGAPRVLIGSDAYAIDAISRLNPVGAWDLIQRRLGRNSGLVKSLNE